MTAFELGLFFGLALAATGALGVIAGQLYEMKQMMKADRDQYDHTGGGPRA